MCPFQSQPYLTLWYHVDNTHTCHTGACCAADWWGCRSKLYISQDSPKQGTMPLVETELLEAALLLVCILHTTRLLPQRSVSIPWWVATWGPGELVWFLESWDQVWSFIFSCKHLWLLSKILSKWNRQKEPRWGHDYSFSFCFLLYLHSEPLSVNRVMIYKRESWVKELKQSHVNRVPAHLTRMSWS